MLYGLSIKLICSLLSHSSLDEPRGSGFIILHDSNSSQFRIEVVTSRNKWTAVLHKIPFTNQWFHLVFTWSVTTGLRISVNGQFLLQDAGAQERKYSLGSVYEDNGILIGGKDPSNGKIQNVKFEMGHLAIWDYALDPWDIQLAYKETIKKNTLSIKCCHELSGILHLYYVFNTVKTKAESFSSFMS